MAMENKRITQLSTERLTLTSGDYVLVDDANNGSAKYRLDKLKETDSTLSVSDMAANAAATGSAISDEATARELADTAIGEDIDDLKSAFDCVVYDGEYEYSAFVQGRRTVANPNVVNVDNGVCTTGKLFYLREGDVLECTNNADGQRYAIASPSPAFDSGWQTGDYKKEITKDALFFVNVSNPDYSPMTPSSVTLKIKITDGASLVSQDHEKIDETYKYVGVPHIVNNWKPGAYATNHTIWGTSTRACINPNIFIPKGTKVDIKGYKNQEYAILGWTRLDDTYTNVIATEWQTLDSSFEAEQDIYFSVNVAWLDEGQNINPTDVGVSISTMPSGDTLSDRLAKLKSELESEECMPLIVSGTKDTDLELGGIYFSNGSAWSFAPMTTMVRTKNNYGLYLTRGSVIRLTDYTDAKFYVGVRDKDGIGINYWGWFTGDFSVPIDGYYGVLISNLTPTEQSDVSALGDLLEITTNGLIERVNILEDSEVVIPSYFSSNMESQIPKIINNINSVGKNGETFIFITDIHWETNYRHSPALIKRILQDTNVRLILCGGDLINTQTKAVASNLIIECLKAYDFPNYIMPVAFGNHDANSLNWQTTEEKEQNEFDNNMVFGLTQKNTSYNNHYFSDSAINFYFDRVDTKTRFIVLDSEEYGEFSSETIPDLCALLNDTPENYHLVIMQHWIISGVNVQTSSFTSSASSVSKIIKAFNDKTTVDVLGTTYDFGNSNGSIELYIGGHTHYDMAYDVNDASNQAGVPIILTNCDSYRDNDVTTGTKDEQCFDVVTIDYEAKKVNCVRIGRGNDRSFSY